MDSAIEVQDLTKTFGDLTAVDNISFSIMQGEIFGLLGPNGAGKSTIIRILTTLLKPTKGIARVHNFDVVNQPEDIRRIIGVCPQNSTLDLELTAYDNLDFYGKLTDVPKEELDSRIYELLTMVGLADRAHMHVSTFSGGMKRKLEIVRAFIHKPRILFLDEPTIGLDPESRREVWVQITNLNDKDTTIILTTHYMDEADKLCNRIAFIDKGILISLDTPENLKHSLSMGDIIDIGVDRAEEGFFASLRVIPGVESVEQKDHRVLISTRNGSHILPALIDRFEEESIPMTSISIRAPSLEDVFISLTGRNLGIDTRTDTSRRGRR